MPQTAAPPATPPNPYAQQIKDAQDLAALIVAQTALQTAQTGAITAQNTALTTRWGTPPALPAGTITGTEHLGGLTSGMLAAALVSSAATIAADAPDAAGKSILITATADRRAAIVAADDINQQLAYLLQQAQQWADSMDPASVVASTFTPTMLTATLGAVENLMGLFRADYTVTAPAVQIDALALQLAVAKALSGKYGEIRVDGLAASESLPFIQRVSEFRRVVDRIEGLQTLEDAEKPARDEFVKRARAFLAANDTKGSDGQSPFHKVALALPYGEPAERILFVKTVAANAVMVSAKSWFSLRNTVHAILTGSIEYAYLDTDNSIARAGLVRINRRASINLRELAKSSTSWDGQ